MQTGNHLITSVTIRELGRQGDGIADTPDGPVYVPFSLAGEEIELLPATIKKSPKRKRGKTGQRSRQATQKTGKQRAIAQILKASPDRIEPSCKHFKVCGGCQLQHFEKSAYLRWKQELVSTAFLRENISLQIEPVLAFGPAARRRAVFTANSNAGDVKLGFLQRDSHHIADIDQCPVLVDALATRLNEFRELAGILCGCNNTIKVSVLACDNGLDVAVDTDNRPDTSRTMQAIEFAGARSFARLSLNSETLIETRRPVLDYGPASVTPPPNGFVQAVAEAENAMAQLVCNHLVKANSVADLFCGHGAFTLRLAMHSMVYAAETSEAAITALDQAWRETGGALKRVTTEKRDLYRRPMNATEMKKIDGVVFDPPRAGAQGQARELALSNVGKVAAVSCNPVTLARDLAILIDGGFKLLSVTPIDQFIYTPHIEAVALLER